MIHSYSISFTFLTCTFLTFLNIIYMILLKYSIALMWFTLKCVSGQCQVHIILTYYSHGGTAGDLTGGTAGEKAILGHQLCKVLHVLFCHKTASVFGTGHSDFVISCGQCSLKVTCINTGCTFYNWATIHNINWDTSLSTKH